MPMQATSPSIRRVSNSYLNPFWGLFGDYGDDKWLKMTESRQNRTRHKSHNNEEYQN